MNQATVMLHNFYYSLSSVSTRMENYNLLCLKIQSDIFMQLPDETVLFLTLICRTFSVLANLRHVGIYWNPHKEESNSNLTAFVQPI